MITDDELAEAILKASNEYYEGDISASILIRDIRNALKQFDSQPTEQLSEIAVNITHERVK